MSSAFHPRFRSFICAAALVMVTVAGVSADDWVMNITVDNQYDIYFGDSTSTDFFAGGDTNWMDTETWNAFGRNPGDFLYVATASDHAVAQGFLGEFTNTTLGNTITTGDSVWEVFPAGKYIPLIDSSWPDPWTPSLMPTQSQVDAAILYATTNGLWVPPTTAPGYVNGSSPSPWGTRPGISAGAEWIWYDSGNDAGGGAYPVPFDGFNHDEFLVFRVPNRAPEPTTLVSLALAGLFLARRR